MHSLETIITINERAVAKTKRNTDHLNREPSFCKSSRGLVLHSASLRSTVFFDADSPAAVRDAEKVEAAFESYAKHNDLKKLNRLVDSFF
jgi:7-keto-8-aminopelargonate synthetase-like enzyme